jgi:type III secretion protein J
MKTLSDPMTAITVLLFGLLLLSGCYQELYTDQPEQQINEMMELLVQAGIPCKKKAGLEGRWSLQVDADKISAAMSLLRENSYPRQTYESMGKVFQKQGLISSPTEERIRFIYALSQEISTTVARIDGVLDARVHIVLPENDPYAEKLVPSSAAVFIKHKADIDLESKTMKIKELVVKSIEGLEFKNVSVALFKSAAGTSKKGPLLYVSMLGFKLAPESAQRFRWLMVVLASLAGSGLVAVAVMLYKRKFLLSEVTALQSQMQPKINSARKTSG